MIGRSLTLLLVLVVAATVFVGPAATPAQAGDTGAIIAGIIIGGLIGAAIADNDRDCHRDRYRYGAPYYRYDPPRCERRPPAYAPYNHGYRDGRHGDHGRYDGHGYRGGRDGRSDYRPGGPGGPGGSYRR